MSEKTSDFSNLNISNSWKEKFALLNKIGADNLFIYKAMSSPEYKELSFRQKMKITSNGWAFLFGPIYYLATKMYAKGLILIALSWLLSALLTLIEAATNAPLPNIITWIPIAVICSQLANYDVYRKILHNETMWGALPGFFSKPIGIFSALFISFAALAISFQLTPVYAHQTNKEILGDISGVWRADTDGAMVAISLGGKQKTLSINGAQIPVSIQSIDRNNNIVTLNVHINGQEAPWVLRQLFDKDGTFTLQMTLHDGTQDSLSFVRNL